MLPNESKSCGAATPGSARVPRAGAGVLASANFSFAWPPSAFRFDIEDKTILARRQNQHARRVRYPINPARVRSMQI